MTSAFLGTSDRTRSSSAAHLEAPRRLPFSPQVQAHKKFKHTAPGGTTTSAFLGPGLSSAHLEAPRRLSFSARATAQAVHASCIWRHRDVCLSRHKRPHTQFKCSAPGGTTTSAFLATSSSTQEVQAHRTWRHHDVCLSRPRVKLSAPGGTMTSAFLGTSDRTRSSSAAHLEAPRRLPFSPQVQAHKKFKHTAPGGTTTSAFLGPGLSSAHLEAP
ncbi:hypothetical protein PF003_g17998 [Phytophthora fragariae]|nr:hypothetical protein PF003_g17998 [Phytophthora fragariae]